MTPKQAPKVMQHRPVGDLEEGDEAPEVSTKGPLTLTVDKVALLTGRSPHLIRRWVREGVLPAVKLTDQQGQPYVIKAADLALVVRHRRWRKKTPPPAVPDRLAAVARISGAIRHES